MTRTGYSPTSQSSRRLRCLRACWWLALGVPLLPLKPRSKHLQPGFGSRKAHISDVACARKWFLNTDANLGVVLDGPSRLLVADWDDLSAYQAWRATLGASVETLVEQTHRGYHAFFFGDERLPSAAQPDCELKTSGACAVSPSVHPSGDVYRIASPAPIAHLSAARARCLFPFLSSAHPLTPLTPTSSPPPLGVGVIARIKAAHSTLDEMLDAGIELRPAGTNTLVGRCPFHDDHTPSLWLYPDTGLWGCNRPDCPAHGIHDVCNFRALRFGISNRAAIRQLARQFL
jgi:hypothetical protein